MISAYKRWRTCNNKRVGLTSALNQLEEEVGGSKTNANAHGDLWQIGGKHEVSLKKIKKKKERGARKALRRWVCCVALCCVVSRFIHSTHLHAVGLAGLELLAGLAIRGTVHYFFFLGGGVQRTQTYIRKKQHEQSSAVSEHGKEGNGVRAWATKLYISLWHHPTGTPFLFSFLLDALRLTLGLLLNGELAPGKLLLLLEGNELVLRGLGHGAGAAGGHAEDGGGKSSGHGAGCGWKTQDSSREEGGDE